MLFRYTGLMPEARPTPPAASAVLHRQHWVAAQRLAHGDRLPHAAYQAGLAPAALREAAADPDFQEARDDEAALLALDAAAWERRMEGLVRQAAERALLDGRVSTLNLLLRARLQLPTLAWAAGADRGRAQRAIRDLAEAGNDEDDEPDEDGSDEAGAEAEDPDAWLADVPVVEAQPEKEAERRRLLAAIEHPGLRKTMAGGSLTDLEQFHAIGDPDPTVYEQWFARQPKPEFKPVALSEEDRAAIRHVARHNPPWIRGEYLGFYRKPVPAELFLADSIAVKGHPPPTRRPAPANDDGPHPNPPPPQAGEGAGARTSDSLPRARAGEGGGASLAPAARPLEVLRSRVARLLDRKAERLAEELDLAEAVCALKWPKWPEYAGAVDLDLLRLVLHDVAIDTETLNWLGGHEIGRACKIAAAK
jgi:hypothetical protein